MLKILVASRSPKLSELLHELMPEALQISVSSTQEAQTYLRQQVFDLCVIQLPLPDEFGIRFARQCATQYPIGVLLLSKKETYDQISYQVKEDGIFVLGLPCSKEIIYQALRCLHASCLQVQKANLQIQKLRRRIREDRLIYQAKLILIEQYHWSEEKAHRYIEQLSMNSSQKKAAVAQMIVDKSMIELK